MANTMYTLRGRLKDQSWEEIGKPCSDFSVCMSDAHRFTADYSCVEVLDQATNELAYRATRRLKG